MEIVEGLFFGYLVCSGEINCEKFSPLIESWHFLMALSLLFKYLPL